MKTSKIFIALAIALAGVTAAGSAFAWRHGGPRVSIGFGFGYPGYGYPYYYPPYAYYPPYYPGSVVLQPRPSTYIEQNPQPAPAVQSPASNYWYYCPESNAYYPYVRECAVGWQRVAPQPG